MGGAQEARRENHVIRCFGVYCDGEPLPDTRDLDLAPSAAADIGSDIKQLRDRVRPESTDFVWLALDNPAHETVASLAKTLGLDPLLVDDSLSRQQRAKLETSGAQVFVLLKVLEWVDESSDVETGQVACFIGPGYAVTLHQGSSLDIEEARRRMAQSPELAAEGPMSVLWAVTDCVVDGYLIVGEAIQDDIEEIEQQVFSPKPAGAATRIYRLNRENIEMRRAVRPLVGEASRLSRDDTPGIPTGMRPYFRDIGDHVLRANDMVDGFDSTLMTMLMASTARQDLMQNRDMRKISAWAAIIAVPTAIAGIYGMNFDDMPELHWAFGYPAVLVLMGTICLFLYRGFKKSGWL